MDFTNQKLLGKRFQGLDLQDADFSSTDLRGADFSFANLKGARFVKVKTGITTASKISLFLLSLVLSLLSGYIAMVSGRTAQVLLQSPDPMLRIGGYITTVFFLVFTIAAVWKGLFKVINTLLPIMFATAIVMGLFMYFTGLGTGKGAIYGSLALLLMAVMFIVGTIARATVGSLGSNLLFIIVALGGGIFGKSLGGGVATMIMAIACAVISKRALADKSGKSVLKKIALRISTSLGTSFKNAILTGANFRDSEIHNTDFSYADLSGINWTRAKGLYRLEDKDVLIHSDTPSAT